MKRYSTYIQSKWNWYDSVPKAWVFSGLKFSLDNIIGGGTPNTSNAEYWDDNNGIPWVSIADISSSVGYLETTHKKISKKALAETNLTIIPKNTLLISIFASLGKTTVLGIDAVVNQAILGLITNESVLTRNFLSYYLMFTEKFISYFSSSNTQENLNLTKIKNLPIYLPSIEEQTAIAKYLDEKTEQIDKLIAGKRRLIELLKEERTAIINQAVTKGINSRAKLKPSGIDWLGDIPEHWEVKKLKYWIKSVVGGGTPSTNNPAFWKGDIPWVSPKDMKTDFIRTTEDYITELAIVESSTNLIKPQKILVVVRSGILKHTLPVAINIVDVALNHTKLQLKVRLRNLVNR